MTDVPQVRSAINGARWTGIALPPSPGVDGSHQDLCAEIEGLRFRLASQPTIEQSKGILMAHYRIGPDAAFNVLRRWSSHSNRKLRDISELIVAAAAAEPAGTESAGPDLIQLIDFLNQGQVPWRSEEQG